MRLLGLRVPRARRRLRLLVRPLEQLCCREEAARRRHRVLQGKLLVWLVARGRHRPRPWAPPWSVVVRRCRMWEQRQLRLLVVQVRVHRRHRWPLAGLQGRQWTCTVDRRRRRAVLQVLQP